MSQYLEDCRDLAREWDAARPRTRQKQIGWSGMADCRSYLAYKLAGEWPTDSPDKWRAITGTVMHDHWWAGLRRRWCAERGIAAAFGIEISYGGITGHVDEVLWPAEPGGRWEVTDYKFPTLGSIRLWNDDDFLTEMFVQPHGYAAGLLEPDAGRTAIQSLIAAGADPRSTTITWSPYELDPDACVVRLLGMPVDAKTMDDWDCQERPFSRDVADDALARLQAVRDSGLPPGDPELRDKPAFFCETWCEFYTSCRGGAEPKDLELITDPELKAAVNAYGLAGDLIRASEKTQKEMRPLIDGLRGVTPEGYQVYHQRGNKAKLELDDAAVEVELGSRGVPLTAVQRWTPPGRQKLIVKRA
jgi:hypothetical protein